MTTNTYTTAVRAMHYQMGAKPRAHAADEGGGSSSGGRDVPVGHRGPHQGQAAKARDGDDAGATGRESETGRGDVHSHAPRSAVRRVLGRGHVLLVRDEGSRLHYRRPRLQLRLGGVRDGGRI